MKVKIFKMNGLQVYINPTSQNQFGGDRIFYSRRSDGPYYYWRYEDGPGRWRVSRVRLSEMAVKALCKANWQSVPVELKAEMIEHYLE